MPSMFLKAVARGAIAIAIVVIVWELAATVSSPFVIPHLGPVFGKMLELVLAANFWTHASATAFRVLAGYLMALVVGLPIGLALRHVPELRFALGALFAGLAAVPFVVLAPVMVLWFGIGSGAKIALAFAAAGFALVSGLMTSRDPAGPAAPGMPPAATAGAPLAPSVVEAARTAFLVAVGAVLVGEIMAAPTGLGNLLVTAMSMFDTVTMFAVVLIVALPCACISAFLRSIEAQVGI